MFIIIRQGVYRHEILGVYDDQHEDEAYRAMEQAAADEPDDYHSIELCSVPSMNEPIKDVEVIAERRGAPKQRIKRI